MSQSGGGQDIVANMFVNGSAVGSRARDQCLNLIMVQGGLGKTSDTASVLKNKQIRSQLWREKYNVLYTNLASGVKP